MSELRFERATPSGPEILLDDWRRIHNLIIPTAPLSGADVRARAGRNRLVVAYLDAVAVGCSTVRPPVGDPPAATVIARILPGYRRRGFGEQLYRRAVTTALECWPRTRRGCVSRNGTVSPRPSAMCCRGTRSRSSICDSPGTRGGRTPGPARTAAAPGVSRHRPGP
jgi:GNAT superfamily N-acetyltransferase